MSTTENQIRELAEQHLGRDVDFDVGVGESDISSMELVAFLKKVEEAFNVPISNTDSAEFQNLRDLVGFIDSRI